LNPGAVVSNLDNVQFGIFQNTVLFAMNTCGGYLLNSIISSRAAGNLFAASRSADIDSQLI